MMGGTPEDKTETEEWERGKAPQWRIVSTPPAPRFDEEWWTRALIGVFVCFLAVVTVMLAVITWNMATGGLR